MPTAKLGSMTTPLPPGIDPRLVAQLSDDVSVLDRQLGQVGRGLAALRFQLDQVASHQIAPQPAPPQNFAPSYVAPPMQAPPPPMPPLPQPRPVQQPRSAQPRVPWWQRDGVISRVLAVAGAGVTLIGIVMLLVLAAQAGFFGPVARVIAGAIFSGALVFAGLRVFGQTGGRVGGIVLAATGIAGGYLDVLAVTAIYGWLEAPLGLGVALGVAAAGVALATKWQSEPLALLVVTGVAVLAPVVTDGLTLTLIAFLVVLQGACFTAQLTNRWSYLHIARTVPVVLALFGAIANAAVDSTDDYRLLAAASVVCAIGLATSFVAVRKSEADVVASVMLGVAAAPLVLAGLLFDRPVSVILEAVAAAVLLAVATYRTLPSHTRIAATVPAVAALLATCVTATTHDTLATALLIVAAAFIAVGDRSKLAYGIGVGFVAIGGLVYLDTARVEALALADVAARELGGAALVASVLLTVAAALLVWQSRRLWGESSNITTVTVIAGVVALYGFTAATVTIGVSLGGGTGFTVGHTVATIAWMVIATALLLRGLRIGDNAHAVLAVGLSLTAAALAKLFLFDLATLDGLLRVAAFIGVGLLLLIAGTRYARAFAEREVTAASAG